eukprot:TRINITY_DN38122_c0_g1_i1.p1 TRINITY_DN38122_c0_g1~~TRINITY_DN38122_c0_g1_i1.p1  ORF type:complete len:253 (+),score=47.99 TRINITY_DN38122_c0_g1_i1:179-937(+)
MPFTAAALRIPLLAVAVQGVAHQPGEPHHVALVRSSSLLQSKQHISLVKPDPKTGAWSAEDLRGRNTLSHCVADAVAQLARERGGNSVGDFGAGNGEYSHYWKGKQGLEVFCVDGNPAIAEASKGLCSNMDLSVEQPQGALPTLDLAVSLEVAEHIPKDRESAYLQNLHAANRRGIVLSWAHPGQTGNGHVNCQPQHYVVSTIESLGYTLNRTATQWIRDQAECPDEVHVKNADNFHKNLMVFDKLPASSLS